jgi:scyllo-inositol 2-dehydrogenase (NAD+)
VTHTTGRARLNVGVIGLGRLGRIYARDLATRIARTRVVAVADISQSAVDDVRALYDIPRGSTDPAAVIEDPAVDAVVIVTPTSTHGELTRAAAAVGKPIFCEKPPAIHLDEAVSMQETVQRAGVFFQLGFMRRFDPGYAAAKAQIDRGAIGDAVVFKSTSRDQFRPPVEYANPKTSGGMIIDMGIHDFDLARWFMGEVDTVQAIGGVLAYPELGEVGDIDNAVVTLKFRNGRLGVIDLTRNGIYGYDIATELLGTKGTVRIGYQRETPLLVMTEGAVTHDTVPGFVERFKDAYTLQLENFADNVLDGREAPITAADGVEALRIAVAATKACHTGQPVTVGHVTATT